MTSTFQHSDDILFLEKAANHRWRTSDPDLAEIFIVPVIFGFLSGMYNNGKNAFRVFSSKDIVDWVKCDGKPVMEMLATSGEYPGVIF